MSALLEDGLWRRNARNANDMARLLSERVAEIDGVRITRPVEANEVFAVLPREAIAPLVEEFDFYVWDERTGEVRWVTSWDTTPEDVESFADGIARTCAGFPGLAVRELPDRRYHLIGVPFDFHLVPCAGDDAIGSDEERPPLRRHAEHLPGAVCVDDRLVRVGNHREGELELVDEPLLNRRGCRLRPPTTGAFQDSSSALCALKSLASWVQPGVFARG